MRGGEIIEMQGNGGGRLINFRTMVYASYFIFYICIFYINLIISDFIYFFISTL